MANLLENPEQFKAELKDKWLNYYQTNRNWLKPLVSNNGNWRTKVRGGYDKKFLDSLGYSNNYAPYRPQDLFILGVVTDLEPQIKGLLAFILKNPDEVISIIGLDFDPEIELKKRFLQQVQREKHADSEYLDTIREEIKT